MSNSLQKIMSFIDTHSQDLPEGDYLEMCNKLRDLFRVEQEQQTRRVRTLPPSLRLNPSDIIYERCLILLRKKKEIKRSLVYSKIRKRITQKFKDQAVYSYCSVMGLDVSTSLSDLKATGQITNENYFFKEFLRIINNYKTELRNIQVTELNNIDNEMRRIVHFMTSTQKIIDDFNAININVPNLS